MRWLSWLRWLNPFLFIFDYLEARQLAEDRRAEYERLERAEQAALFRASIESMSRMVEKAFEVNAAQNATFQTFLDGFKTPEPPKMREYDEAEEVKRFMDRRAGKAAALPTELAGLSQLEQMEALLAKLDGVDEKFIPRD